MLILVAVEVTVAVVVEVDGMALLEVLGVLDELEELVPVEA